MQVKLISYSKPSRQLVDEGLYDVQELVAFCARVSNPANQYNTETSEKLIKYLIKHAHWSPLEMASACLDPKSSEPVWNIILVIRLSDEYLRFCVSLLCQLVFL